MKILIAAVICLVLLLLYGCGAIENEYTGYRTETALRFPIPGESMIALGGREKMNNPLHMGTTDQFFALDIVAMAPGSEPPPLDNFLDRALSGKIAFYKGDYKNNEDHYCFGRPIVSPGDGLIYEIKDGVHDNIPGKRNKKDVPGNYVIIDHLNGEHSMLAHFKKGSVIVKAGDTVASGDLLGLCGNSGNSYLPHLHYHLQNTPHWFGGEGLPAQFQNYIANGTKVARGEPMQGQIISAK